MELDMNLILIGPDRKALEQGQRKKGDLCPTCGQERIKLEPMTFRETVVTALGATIEKDRGLSGEKKTKRAKLAFKLYDADKIDLAIEELSLIKERTLEICTPFVAFAIDNILEQKKENTDDGTKK